MRHLLKSHCAQSAHGALQGTDFNELSVQSIIGATESRAARRTAARSWP